jgi:hypothetical protein
MTEQLVAGATVTVIVLLFLRFGNRFVDCVCRTIDPAPDIIDKYCPDDRHDQ